MKTLIYKFAMVLTITIGLISCSEADDDMISQDAFMKTDMAKKMNKPGTESIAEIAINNGFDELVGALQYVDTELDAGLVNLFINGKDQYTVFAPTNDAFYALYDALGDDVQEITDLPAELVLNVLLYHVVEGRRASFSVVPKNNYKYIETLLEGATFMVDSSGMITAKGNTANIVAADFSASNGIVHVIDAVILPIE